MCIISEEETVKSVMEYKSTGKRHLVGGLERDGCSGNVSRENKSSGIMEDA